MSVVSVRIDNAMLGEIESLREHVQELDVDRLITSTSTRKSMIA
jgi:hypothetical protein